MKYFIYCRKSSEAEDRQILSISSQISELKRLAQQRGLEVLEVIEEARSAKAPGRNLFDYMMQRIYKGEAHGIVCWKLDRLARNPVDGGSVIWALKQHGLSIVTPTQTFSQAEDNIILMYIEFGMAQKYIDDLSRNVKRGLRTKLEQGWKPGPAPLGYLNDTSREKGDRIIIRDPRLFPLIRRMWDLMLSGTHTPPEIVRIANEEWGFRTRQAKRQGGKALPLSSIYRLFTNPFYYGWFEYPRGSNQWHKGQHQPIVTKEEYDKVQRILGRKGNPRAITYDFAYTGLIRCGECAGNVTAEEKHHLVCPQCRMKFAYRNKDQCPKCLLPISSMRKATYRSYTYYHCTKKQHHECSQGSIEVKELERQIEIYLSLVQVSPELMKWSMRHVPKFRDEELSHRAETLASNQKAHESCKKQLEALINLMTSPANANRDLLSDDEYLKRRTALLKEKESLENQMDHAAHRIHQNLYETAKTLHFSSLVQKAFAEGDIKTKKEIVTTIGSNLSLKDKKLSLDVNKPFTIAQEILSGIPPARTLSEPEKYGVDSAPNPSTFDTFYILRGKCYDVRTLERIAKEIVRKILQYYRDKEKKVS